MTENVERIIIALEDELQSATLENDVATTDALLADDWLNINATGSVTTKAQSLSMMPRFRFISIVNEDVKIRRYPGVAVVTGVSTRELEGSDNKIMRSRVLFTRVYAQAGGRWRVVTSQATHLAGE